MDGSHWRWPPPQPSSSQPQTPNFPFQNVYPQPVFPPPPFQHWQQQFPNFPLNFPIQNPTFLNPSFPYHHQQPPHPPTHTQPPPPPPPPPPPRPRPPQPPQQQQFSSPASAVHSQGREITVEKVDQAVAKARADLIAAGESVSAWKVSQAALVALQVDSWSSLGFPMQQVPSLQSLIVTEGKINAFIHCFVAVRRITSLYELGLEICKNEGVEQFEEMGLGPLVRHPLVLHYFSVNLDTTEVLKITTEDIIDLLSKFKSLCNNKDVKDKDIKVEEFLDFIAEKRSDTGKDKLGIRIHNIGKLCSIIRKAKKSEDTDIHRHGNGSKPMQKKGDRRPLFSMLKKQLDERFQVISERVGSFNDEKTGFCGKHTRFVLSSSEDERSNDGTYEDDSDYAKDNHSNFSSQFVKSSDRVSSCPYPSAIEEMTRLGLKGESKMHTSSASDSQKHHKSIESVKKKRKYEQLNSANSAPAKLRKTDNVGLVVVPLENENSTMENSNTNEDDFGSINEDDFSLSNESLRMFITIWKERCRGVGVGQVLKRMIRFYKVRFLKRMKSIYSSYPFIGILNIAVLSIKLGMWDSIYDTVQAINQYDLSKPLISDNCEYESIDVEPSTKDSTVIPESTTGQTKAVSAEDIIKKVAAYLKPDQEVLTNDKSPVEKRFSIIRNLSNCEHWLAEQFRVKGFRSLGYGDFALFLEKYATLLPTELCEFLTGDISVKSPFEVCMAHQQLVLLLSQASNNLWEDKNVTKQDVFSLLMRQFPFISFKIVSNGSLKDFLSMAVKDKNFSIPKSVIFSLTLSTTSNAPEPSGCSNSDLLDCAYNVQDVRTQESVTSKDAIELLLKAPMLSDLNLWSHWDVRFAPSLGPLVQWLLKEVKTDELLCLVTRDGKVVRIDPSATVESFLEAAIQGSSYQTAVKLLSLFSVVGGQKHVPISLLKCHAQQAFKVMLKNSLESVESSGFGCSLFNGKVLFEDGELTSANSSNESQNNLSKMNVSVSATSKFVLDCLCYLPAEIRVFAADVLLSGMQSVIKDAASAILRECSQMDQRLMLHEVGLSLGVAEWINDYHAFCSRNIADLFPSDASCLKASDALCLTASDASCSKVSDASCSKAVGYQIKTRSKYKQDVLDKVSPAEDNRDASVKVHKKSKKRSNISEASDDIIGSGGSVHRSERKEQKDAALVIQSIRSDEFGLDPSLSNVESVMLKKQHARLGRALHCLSQELYSQDSHFLLELVQNADDNAYPENVEPTLTFILQDSGIVVLNNERGFSAENIRALCDIGNSTKKGSNAGYIGQKGIGFKSVFRITDAPEIHSNGFHIKFDISEGQIGFVLPTIIPPCDLALFSRLSSSGSDQLDVNHWSTCIVLPFRSRPSEGNVMRSIMAMFSDLHPSLLLFLHRLQCIKFRNLLEDSLIIMRKEVVGDGIINVSHGKEKMTWFVVSETLRSDFIRPDVQTTEISIAFTLQESANGGYSPHLSQQPVFAFLPLRTYGLKFILQGNFVLPSSREEVDGSSPWNQWLLSEFPGLFVKAERSFCALPCFKDNPGKAVAAFMSFVPLVGEVHGFFSSLPRLIISKLRMSNCLVLDGHKREWVPPCKVLRGWNEQARSILTDSLLHEHLGLGFLDKHIVLSDALARALGVEEYGPKILVQILSSLCGTESGLKLMGFGWLSSCLTELYTMLVQCSGRTALETEVGVDVINNLQRIPFIPLSNGSFTSVSEGTVWLHFDASSSGFDGEHRIESFPCLYSNLRIVSPDLLSASSVDGSRTDLTLSDNLTMMLYKVGVQKLSAHEIIKLHILPALSDKSITRKDKNVTTEYVCFVMSHLHSSCSDCHAEREYIMSELHNKAYILTNNGVKRLAKVSIHFGKEFGNPVDISKLIDSVSMKWHEVDISYLKHPINKTLPSGQTKWRQFFQELGVTDFVKVVQVEKTVADMSHALFKSFLSDGDPISLGSIVKDWESQELVNLLSVLSKVGKRKNCEYLLEVLDNLWDSCFSDKATGYCTSESVAGSKPFKSSFISAISDVQWVASTMDDKLHYSKDLYHDCDAVRSVLGISAPYAVPKVKNEKLVNDIGFKTKVSLIDVFEMLKVWRCKTPFMASITQMSKLYTFIWSEVAASKKLAEEFHSEPFIFMPYTSPSRHEDLLSGIFLSPNEVYWRDSTGAMDEMKEMHPPDSSTSVPRAPLNKTLYNIYPGLRDFFINMCGVHENPPLPAYLQILRQLSRVTLPSQAAKAVFQVLLKWTDGLKSGLDPEDVVYLKKSLKKVEYTVLPTMQDKWVSLHRSFGLVCWCDDKKLIKHFKHMDGIEFLFLGKLSKDEKEMLQTKVSVLMRTLGIPALSDVVSREAIYYGVANSTYKASLVNWALPYAQRYLHNADPDRYSQLKQSGFDILNTLQVVVVEKLFYRNVIKGCSSTSEKRVECTCLLQDNILYATQDSDAHALFMELSRLFFNGKPELHVANFLHMITTMAESGSSEDQTEIFILNSQKIPKLPDGEPVWSLASVSSLADNDATIQTDFADNDATIQTDFASRAVNEQSSSAYKRRAPTSSNWPPRDWTTAPGFDYARANGFRTQAWVAQPSFSSHFIKEDDYLNIDEADIAAPLSIDNDWSIEDDTRASTALPLSDSSRGQQGNACDENDPVGFNSAPELRKSGSSQFHKRDQIRIGIPNEQGSLTGRLGEQVAFKYFIGKAGKEAVKWVNEHKETGLPYDLVVKEENGSEFIEVKATVSPRKNWLMITPREWHFAVDKGDAFSIAHVVLLKNKVARVSVFKNPVKLLQQRKLQLVIVMPTEQDFSIVS